MELIKIDPVKRRRYRIRIYTGFAILLAALVGGTWVLDTFFRPRLVNVYSTEELVSHPDVQLFQEYVRIDTTEATGSEAAGAEFLARELAAAGIEPVIERLGDRRANVWGILEGEERGAVVLHNHIDVFQVRNPDAWSSPPFAAEIDGVWLVGRGTFDMKSVAIVQLRAIQELARSGRKPKKSVIFLATGGEETGSDLGVRWILKQHPDLVERFDLVLTEGGVVEPKSQEEIKYWGVEFAQKSFAQLVVCAERRERLEELREDVLLWRLENEVWRLTPEVETFLAAYSGSRDRSYLQRVLTDPWKTIHRPKDFRKLPPYLRSAFRDEVVPLHIEELEDGTFRRRLFLHVLPGGDTGEIRRRLLPDWMLHGLTVAEEPELGSHDGSPIDGRDFQTILETVRERYPRTEVGPYFLPWSATDSRFFREAGIPSYGFSPFLIFSTDTYRVDAANERISLPGFLTGLELYIDVVERLAG